MTPRHLGVGVLFALMLIPTIPALAQGTASTASTSALRLGEISGTTVSRSGAPKGSAVAVTATVQNRGSATATQARVSYRLPPGIEFDQASSSATCVLASAPGSTSGGAPGSGASAEGGRVDCSLGSIAAGGSAPINIGVRAAPDTTVLGSRTGYFFALQSNQFDPQAGEIRVTSWNHESGYEGSSLTQCWPITNPTPLMDISGGVCDGTNDSPALLPDEITVVDAFPGRFAEVVDRSWQFETRVSIPTSGQYLVCGELVDDGAYVAVTPAGTAFTDDSIVLDIASYSSAVSAPFPLDAARKYDVLIRVSNRGAVGIDNAAGTGSFGGWNSFGLGLARDGCGPIEAQSFGTASTALIAREGADVMVVGSADLAIVGGIQSTSTSGQKRSSIRVRNLGLDAASTMVTVTASSGTSAPGQFVGCTGTVKGIRATCPLGSIDPNTERVIAVDISALAGWTGWIVESADAIDSTQNNNANSAQ